MILSGVGSFAVCARTVADAQTSSSSATAFSRVRVLFVGRKRARRRARGPVVFVGIMFFKTRESGGNVNSRPTFFIERKRKRKEDRRKSRPHRLLKTLLSSSLENAALVVLPAALR